MGANASRLCSRRCRFLSTILILVGPKDGLRESKTEILVNSLSIQRRSLAMANPIRKLTELFDFRALDALKNLDDSD